MKRSKLHQTRTSCITKSVWVNHVSVCHVDMVLTVNFNDRECLLIKSTIKKILASIILKDWNEYCIFKKIIDYFLTV
jgi:hypothetical protein